MDDNTGTVLFIIFVLLLLMFSVVGNIVMSRGAGELSLCKQLLEQNEIIKGEKDAG